MQRASVASRKNAAERIRAALAESIRVKQATADQCAAEIAEAADRLAECFARGGKLLCFGNGGSASDAQHIASEFVGRYVHDRPALPALALCANSSETTAIGNDYGFDHTFERGIEAHGREGDVALALSTSGNSTNVLRAVEVARRHGLETIALLGKGGGKLALVADVPIVIPSDDTPRVQEAHIAIGHLFCELVEAALFAGVRESDRS